MNKSKYAWMTRWQDRKTIAVTAPQYTVEPTITEPVHQQEPMETNKKRTTAVVQSLLTLNLIP